LNFNFETDTKSIVQTHTVCTTQIDKTDTRERFAMAMEAEPQVYQNFLDTTAH